MELEFKCKILKNGKKVFGKGLYELLKEIDKVGSLNKAIKTFDMSYSKAWSIIKNAETQLGYSLLVKNIGGEHGGGSYLTEEAREFMDVYEKFSKEAEEMLEALFKKYFSFP